MESSNSGSFQSDNEHEYDDSNNNFTQSQSVSSASAVANNFLINNNNNNNPTTNNSFNHHQLLEQASTFYNHLHPPVQVQVQVQPTSSLLSSIQDPSWSQTIPTCTFTLQNPSTTDAAHHIGVVKNPKKRTRASRRAPTTVLTTDTTNFRQMVQEFTGIPTAPFTRRLRPKIQSPLAFLNNNNNNNNNIVAESSTSINNTTTSNYNFSPSNITNFQKQPSSTFLDLQQNPPMFSFQSLILQNSLPKRSWPGEDHETNFEGVMNGNTQNIGGSKLNSSLLEMNASTADQLQVQVQGNQGSWICPSN